MWNLPWFTVNEVAFKRLLNTLQIYYSCCNKVLIHIFHPVLHVYNTKAGFCRHTGLTGLPEKTPALESTYHFFLSACIIYVSTNFASLTVKNFAFLFLFTSLLSFVYSQSWIQRLFGQPAFNVSNLLGLVSLSGTIMVGNKGEIFDNLEPLKSWTAIRELYVSFSSEKHTLSNNRKTKEPQTLFGCLFWVPKLVAGL